jgi:hypothetical protein
MSIEESQPSFILELLKKTEGNFNKFHFRTVQEKAGAPVRIRQVFGQPQEKRISPSPNKVSIRTA